MKLFEPVLRLVDLRVFPWAVFEVTWFTDEYAA